MSKELTEREKVLLGWVVFLVDVVNRYSVFFGLINRDVKWLDGIWENDDIKGKQDELVEFLANEFDMSLTKTTTRELLEKDG